MALSRPASDRPPIRLLDPYAVPGTYFKAQLHVHTDRSDGRWTLAAMRAAYAARGYDFVAITDHDRLFTGHSREIEGDGPLLIGGEEHTIPRPVWPLGRHVLRLFATRPLNGRRGRRPLPRLAAMAAAGDLICLAHPSWTGPFGTGRWEEAEAVGLAPLHMVEVYNSHSDPEADTAIWHAVARSRGPRTSVWASAGDDAHNRAADDHDCAWVMACLPERSLAALEQALRRGAFYPTTGPIVRFGASGGAVLVHVEHPAADVEVRFIDAAGAVRAIRRDRQAHYDCTGDEGFVRVEVLDRGGRSRGQGRAAVIKAWSQPFWLA